jgi:hypothetical protein
MSPSRQRMRPCRDHPFSQTPIPHIQPNIRGTRTGAHGSGYLAGDTRYHVRFGTPHDSPSEGGPYLDGREHPDTRPLEVIPAGPSGEAMREMGGSTHNPMGGRERLERIATAKLSHKPAQSEPRSFRKAVAVHTRIRHARIGKRLRGAGAV